MLRKQFALLETVMLLISIFIFSPLLATQEPDLTDPVKVANDVLNFIQSDNAEGMLAVMDPDQKQAYLPFTPDKRQEILRVMGKDKEKIGKVKEVTEIRECTTFSGKPGIAAKIREKSSELYVIILSKENNSYYYDNLLTLTPDAYDKLKLIKKI
jgi:predicted glycosyltransferase